MSTWPSRGGLRRPLRGAEKMKTEQQHQVVRPCRSDSSQQASTKPGAVHNRLSLRTEVALEVCWVRTTLPGRRPTAARFS